jgi:phage FluMu protein Com
MKTKKEPIKDQYRREIKKSQALLWGNNASWLCTQCGELLGNRTGDTEYQVKCATCNTGYEIERKLNRAGRLHFGPAIGVRKIS